jgi:phosphoglycerate dehydrogenase-like enzyme
MHESLPYIHNCFLTFPFTAFLKEVNIEQLKQNNVVSASAKEGNKYAVAEWNLMALLNLTRHTAEILQSTKKL